MKRAAIFTALLITLLFTWITPSATGSRIPVSLDTGYDLSWSTIDGGGGMSSNDIYTLNGSIGQPDAGTLAGTGYTLTGGFWGGRTAQYRVYLPLVLRH
jgi:hypothetical protein